jgi:DNA-binding response OmpR family regulator
MATRARSMRDKCILVVDDEADILDFVSHSLISEGCKVIQAENRDEAFELFKNEKPDAIILDLNMRGMDAREFVKRVKELKPSVCIILMTAALHAPEKALELGLEYYIPKPFDHEDVYHAVSACVNNL